MFIKLGVINENGKVIKTFDKEYEINYNYDEEEKLISENYNNLQISYSEQQNEDGEILSETIIYSIDSEQILRKDICYNKSRISRIDYVYNDKTISINYTYDLNGNIEFTLTNTYNEEDELIHTKTEEYVYDSLNQLSNHKVYENNNQILNVTYTYDLYGNIQTITRYTHLNEYASLPGYEEYTYDEEYKDLLINKIEKESLTGNTINTYTYIYDSTKANLLEVKKNDEIIETYTYLHRNLITYINESTRIEYKYNSEGIRYQKAIYDKVTNQLLESRKYFLDGYKIISEEVTNITESYAIYYKYDTNEEVIGYTYEEENDIKEYTYIKNYQGDVIGIIDETKQVVTEYVYDAYGQVINGDVSINSLLYRSYYYDHETSYYYLNSRYYNPENARFQIADEITYLGITGTINSYNLFGYCENNSVNSIDDIGYTPKIVGFGFQFYINISWFGCGFEVVWFHNKQVSTNGQNRFIPYIYMFLEVGAGVTSSKIKGLLKEVGKKPDKIFNPKTFRFNFSFSICFFVIIANSDFDDPTDYEGPFKSVAITIRHIKGYVATSSTCISIGGGWHSKGFAISGAVSNYWLISSSYSSFMSIRNKVQSNSNNYS